MGRLVALLRKITPKNAKAAVPYMGQTSVMNGLIRLGSSVKISKALWTIFTEFIYEPEKENQSDAKTFSITRQGEWKL